MIYDISVVMKATALALGRMETHPMRPTSLSIGTPKGCFFIWQNPDE